MLEEKRKNMLNNPNEILDAIKQICKEKWLSIETVMETVEQALAAAYRKDFGKKDQNIKVKFDLTNGNIKAFDSKVVVDYGPEEEEETIEEGKEEEKKEKKKTKKGEAKDKEGQKEAIKDKSLAEVSGRKIQGEPKASDGESSFAKASEGEEKKRFNPKFHLTLEDAKKIKKGAKVDDEIITELEVPAPFGRMAAQTAKQVIIQRLKEAERDVLFKEYKEKEGDIVSGVIQRKEGRIFLVDLGKVVAILLPEGQVRKEYYNSGQRIKAYIVSVRQSLKGPEIIVSRTHPEIIRELFNLEIPEITSKAVEIKSIAREAGERSKIAVFSSQENLDPVGACIGQRGVRIQTIISEAGGEKIDIIEYDEDEKKYISNALSPAKILKVELDEKNKIAKVKVKEDQLSLSIGKGGQNVRLASQLTGWAIEIGPGIEEDVDKIKDESENKDEDKEEKKDKDNDKKKEKVKKVKIKKDKVGKDLTNKKAKK